MLDECDAVAEQEHECFVVTSGPHRGKRFPPPANGRVFKMSQVRCWHCEQKGHLKRHCPVLAARRAQEAQRDPPPGSTSVGQAQTAPVLSLIHI